MGTNYYVNAPSCANACEHCTETELIHLGKSCAGLRFVFFAEPEWPRDEAFRHWVRRALSGPITDEYGKACTLAELLDLAESKADDLYTACTHDFLSCGHVFCSHPFS